MIVLDSSVLLEIFLLMPGAAAVETRIFARGETLHAPYLVDIEVAHVVRRSAFRSEMEGRRGKDVLADMAGFPLRRYSHQALLPRIWELRDNLTAYDAAYVALAEALDAPLLTKDARLARASGHEARIELV